MENGGGKERRKGKVGREEIRRTGKKGGRKKDKKERGGKRRGRKRSEGEARLGCTLLN